MKSSDQLRGWICLVALMAATASCSTGSSAKVVHEVTLSQILSLRPGFDTKETVQAKVGIPSRKFDSTTEANVKVPNDVWWYRTDDEPGDRAALAFDPKTRVLVTTNWNFFEKDQADLVDLKKRFLGDNFQHKNLPNNLSPHVVGDGHDYFFNAEKGVAIQYNQYRKEVESLVFGIPQPTRIIGNTKK